MSTPINNIKNWFKTGLKPTQEQFWAWMDSYWHKAEKIPMSSIDGIDTALENKADAQQLVGKADLISGKVPLSQLPFGDDVLHYDTFSAFPPIGEVGKFYIDTAEDSSYIWDNEIQAYKSAGSDEKWRALMEAYLSEKLDKPTSEGSTMTHPYVLLLDAAGSPVLYPADGLGKNIGNTNLKVPVGTIRELDVEGALFKIKGLTDKSADATYDKKIIVKNGEFALAERGETIISPNIAINGELKVTANHIYPNPMPSAVTYPSEVVALMSDYKNKTFVNFTENDWIFVSEPGVDVVTLEKSGSRIKAGCRFGPSFTDIKIDSRWNILSRTFRSDKQWIVVLDFKTVHQDTHEWGTNFIGLSQNSNISTHNNSATSALFFNASYIDRNREGDGRITSDYSNIYKVIIAHANNAIYYLATNVKGDIVTKLVGNTDIQGDYRVICKPVNQVFNSSNATDISAMYWIQP